MRTTRKAFHENGCLLRETAVKIEKGVLYELQCRQSNGKQKKLTGMPTAILSFVMLCAGNLHAQQSKPLPLNDAIIQAARLIEERLPAETRLAILDFSSDSEELSNYSIDQLSGELVNGNKVTVIERQRRGLIRKEIAIHLSGDVDDDYMARIGKQWGAQVIIYGSLRKLGDTLVFMIKSVNVENARIEAQVSCNIDKNDPLLAGIFGESNMPLPVPASSSGESEQPDIHAEYEGYLSEGLLPLIEGLRDINPPDSFDYLPGRVCGLS